MASTLYSLYRREQDTTVAGSGQPLRNNTTYTRISQSYIPLHTSNLYGIDIQVFSIVGSPTGNLWIEFRDIGATPETGSILATSSSLDVSTFSALGIYSVTFSVPPLGYAGQKYYAVINSDSSINASNYVNIGYKAIGVSNVGYSTFNGTVWGAETTWDISMIFYTDFKRWPVDYVNGNNSNDGKGWKKAAFTSGGTYAPSVGQVLIDNATSRTATIQEIVITSGTFAAGDAAGSIYIFDNASGAFTAGGTCDIGSNIDVLTLTADFVYSSFKDVTGCTTAKGVVGGDIQELAKSPDPYDTGVNITVTNQSANMTLSAPLTKTINNLNVLRWTPVGSGVTETLYAGLNKFGASVSRIDVPTAFTTGKIGYFDLGSNTDLSAYSRISFWIGSVTTALATTSGISLKLCSDVAGDTPVDANHVFSLTNIGTTLAPTNGGFSIAQITKPGGGAISNAVRSVGLYVDTDLSTTGIVGLIISNLIACNSVSHSSLIKIGAPRTKWLPSVSKSQNDEIVCNYAYENGDSFLYYKKVNSGAHTTGTGQPSWPVALGEQVTDGTVVWECMGEDEAWWQIQSIDGTALRVDFGGVNQLPGTAQQGYYGRSNGTYALWAREAIKLTPVTATTTALFAAIHNNKALDDLSVRGRTYGGVNPATGIVDGETYYDGQNGLGIGYVTSATVGYRDTLENLAFVRTNYGFQTGTASFRQKFQLLDNVSVSNYGINATPAGCRDMEYLGIRGCGSGFAFYGKVGYGSKAKGFISINGSNGSYYFNEILYPDYIKGVYSRNAYNYGMYVTVGLSEGMMSDVYVSNVRANAGCVMLNVSPSGTVNLKRALLSDSLEFVGYSTSLSDNAAYSQDHDQITGNHQIFWNGGKAQYIYDGSFKHGNATGSWRLNPLNVIRNSGYPLRLTSRYLFVRCIANTQVTIKVWYYKNHANINGKIYVAANQLKGMPETVVSSITSTVGSWQYLTASFTPTETGVAYWQFHCWDGVTTDKNLYISDFSQTFG